MPPFEELSTPQESFVMEAYFCTSQRSRLLSGAKGAVLTSSIMTTTMIRKMARAVPARLTALTTGSCFMDDQDCLK